MGSLSYLDFDLVIEKVEGRYRAQVNSPAGQAVATFDPPFSDLELENFLLRVGRTRLATRRIDAPEVKAAKAFGERLFSAVFTGEVRGCLRSSIEEAKRSGGGLRIRLHLNDAPELADLPWEYLYNPSLNYFLGLSVETPVVRYLDLPERIQPLLVAPPLRVLVMISSPLDYPELNVEQELAKVREALGGLEQRGLVAIERLPEASLLALQHALRRGTYHVFHFVGHGGFDTNAQDGVLILEGESRRGRAVSSQDLGVMLRDHRSLRLAVLNACEGARTSRTDPFAGTAQTLVQQGLAAVIAMQFEITDEAAITFAREFYGAVADGYPVDAALVEARKTIFAQGNGLEWGTPVLYLRAPDGRIFDLDRTTTETMPVREEPDRRPVSPAGFDFALGLMPPQQSSRAAARFTLVLDNKGSAPVTFALSAADPGQRCVYEFTPTGPTVGPGESVRVRLTVRPARRRLFGGAAHHRFTVTATPGGRADQARSVEGQFVSRPVLPAWAPAALLALVFAVALGAALGPWAPSGPPVINSFAANPAPGTPILPGTTVMLSWRVRNADVVRIMEAGSLIKAGRDQTGTTTVVPTAQGSHKFELVVSRGARTAQSSLTVLVAAKRPVAAPVVRRFEVHPAEVESGQKAVLSWDTSGADTVTITGLSTHARSGSASVQPEGAGKTTYTLTATNAGGTVKQTVVVAVRAAQTPKPGPITPSPQKPPAGPTLPAAGVLTVSPRGVEFGAQPLGTRGRPRPVTLRNSGRGPVSIQRVVRTGDSDFSVDDQCSGITLGPGNACTVTVSFTPSAGGTRSATLTLVLGTPASQQVVALRGAGSAAGVLSVSPSRLDFGTQPPGTKSQPEPVRITNQGQAPLTIGRITLAGDQAYFSMNDPCSGTTLGPGETCTVTLTFTAAGSESRSASLAIPTGAPGSPQVVQAQGAGLPALAAGVLVARPATLEFPDTYIYTKGAPQAIHLNNSGPGPVTVQRVALGSGSDFVITDDKCTGVTVAAGGNCTIMVGFSPQTLGRHSAVLTVTHNAPGIPLTVRVQGTGYKIIPGRGIVTD